MCRRITQFGSLLLLSVLAWGGVTASESQEISDAVVLQSKATCTGIVKDASGAMVTGASVVVKGTTNGTTSIDGQFVLQGVPTGSVIEVSFIGYKTTEVTFNGSRLEVTLQDDDTAIDEVVVTAYGQVKQAKQVGYATTRVDVSEIERTNVINPVQALQGKVAGVQIDAGGSSGLTSSSSITIRGAKSTSKNNSPIWVIDGMVIQEDIYQGNAMYGNAQDLGSQLKNLNPADYESVTVLKGAAATALYGSRGANGAIVIVSKSGKGMKRGIGVELNQTLEWTNIYKSPIDLQNVYGMGSNWTADGYDGGFAADGTLGARTLLSWGPKMDGRMINQYMPDGKETPFVAHPDNWKALYQGGLNSTTNVAVSGGTDKSSFRLSYGYMDTKGVMKGNEFNRHNISFRGNTQLSKVFSVDMGVQYAFSKAYNGAAQGLFSWDLNTSSGLIGIAQTARSVDMKYVVDNYRDPATGKVRNQYDTHTRIVSYMWQNEMNVNLRQENSMLADLTLRAHIADWLEASVKGNYNYYVRTNMSKTYPQQLEDNLTGYGYSRSGDLRGNYNFVAMLQSNNIKLDRSGDFLLSLTAAAELYGNMASFSWSKSTSGGFKVPGVFTFANSANDPKTNNAIDMGYTPRNQMTLGVFGIANFSWKDQVFLELTARNDWLSTLTYPAYVLDGQNNYSVFYPSANASWVFSDTFNLPDWMSMGRLRASISRVGMGTNAYATIQGYGVFGSGFAGLPDNDGSAGWANPNLGTAFNPDLKPEIQQSLEFGLDLRFFNERLNLDATYYKTNTFNQIMSVGSVAESGATSMMINAGNIQNQGLELSLEGTPIVNKDWRWTVGTNISFNRGKVKKLHDNVKELQLLGSSQGTAEIWAYEGGAFGVLTSTTGGSVSPRLYFEGEPGDPRNGKMLIFSFADLYSADGTYPGMGGNIPFYPAYTRAERGDEGDYDRHIVGKVEPDCMLSINTSLSWRNFDLFVSADGRFGGNFYSYTYASARSAGNLASTLEGRDAEHGGIKRINRQGQTVYDGYPIDGVFIEGSKAPRLNSDGTLGELLDVGGMTYMDAVNNLGIAPTTSAAWFRYDDPLEAIQDNTWFMLREISLGYRLPERICKKFGANYLRLGFTARNICYIVNKLSDHLNPQSISSNNPLTPVDWGGVPFYRTFSFNLTVRF